MAVDCIDIITINFNVRGVKSKAEVTRLSDQIKSVEESNRSENEQLKDRMTKQKEASLA
jgi:cell division protein FtsB